MDPISDKASEHYPNFDAYANYEPAVDYNPEDIVGYDPFDWQKGLTEESIEKLYKALDGRRFFKREDIIFMEQQLELVHALFSQAAKIIKDCGSKDYENITCPLTFRDALGKEHKFKVPVMTWMKPEICFFGYQASCDPQYKGFIPNSFVRDQQSWAKRPILPEPMPDTPPANDPSWNTFSWYNLGDKMIPMFYFPPTGAWDPETGYSGEEIEQVKSKWELRRERHEIMKKTEEINVPITSIFCIGLGSFRLHNLFIDKEKPEDGKWDVSCEMDQHFAIFDMVSILKKKAPETKIRMVFQDPAYVDSDRSYIRTLGKPLGIIPEFVESPRGLLEIDSSSFVYSPGRANFPIQQIIADLTMDFGGPAAIFTGTVRGARQYTVPGAKKEEYTVHDELKDWAAWPTNCPNRYVVEMLKNYEDVLDTQVLSDNPSLYMSSLYVKKQH